MDERALVATLDNLIACAEGLGRQEARIEDGLEHRVMDSLARDNLAACRDRTRGEVLAELRRLQAEAADHDASFDLYWRAQQRGVAAWRAAHPGNDLVSPDTAHLATWLLEQLDQARADWLREKSRADRGEGELDVLRPAVARYAAALQSIAESSNTSGLVDVACAALAPDQPT